jgi:hypothetical protein
LKVEVIGRCDIPIIRAVMVSISGPGDRVPSPWDHVVEDFVARWSTKKFFKSLFFIASMIASLMWASLKL